MSQLSLAAFFGASYPMEAVECP
uniref:Uncharacterized protein n=1 Tax=Rhizophora mucronata TaxID=61149 RepID=A0A2P2JH70_RHIMU